jgi:hypothetical protein
MCLLLNSKISKRLRRSSATASTSSVMSASTSPRCLPCPLPDLLPYPDGRARFLQARLPCTRLLLSKMDGLFLTSAPCHLQCSRLLQSEFRRIVLPDKVQALGPLATQGLFLALLPVPAPQLRSPTVSAIPQHLVFYICCIIRVFCSLSLSIKSLWGA